MSLPELSIHRHVLAWMMSGVLVLFGIIGYQGMGVDRFPAVDLPFITVTTALPGASPDVIDESITNLIEEKVNSVPGIDHIQSMSLPNVSIVVIAFELDKNGDVAFNEVQAKINQVIPALPDDADTPMVAKMEFGALPVLWLTVQGDRTLQQLNEYADKVLRKRLENIDGVGEVRIGGERKRTIRVELETQRLAAFDLTIDELLAAFGRAHVRMPGGYLVAGGHEELLKLDLEFHDLDALRDMVVATRDGAPVRLADLGQVVDGLADNRSLARYNAEPAVALGLVKVSGANTVAIVEAVNARLETEIRPNLPDGLRISVAYDDGALILEIVHALQEHLLIGMLLAGVVVWLFLKNFTSTLIVATAIPVSLFGAVAAMYFAGYTFNTLTMLALLLLIGVVVDDAIVVLESIYRQREEGVGDPRQAALRGTQRVVFAVLAATLTLVAIFTPVLFMQGIVARFFESFAVVVVVGVLTSWFVAMTLTPMLCSRYLYISARRGPVVRLLDRAFNALDHTYLALLRLALRFRWSVVLVTLATLVGSSSLLGTLGGSFMPPQDEGRFLITFKTPLGSSIDYSSARLAEIERVLAADPAVAGYFATIGDSAASEVHKGTLIVNLKPRAERDADQTAVMQRIGARLKGIPGVATFTGEVPNMGGDRGEPLQFLITGQDLDQVAQQALALKARLDPLSDRIGPLDLELNLNLPQLETRLDRERISALGLSAQQVATALYVLVGGYDVARFNESEGSSERYEVRMKAAPGQFGQLDDLAKIELRTASGERVGLDDLVQLQQTLGPVQINRYDLQYAAQFYATPIIDLQSASKLVEAEAKEVLHAGYQLRLAGEAEEFKKTAGYIIFAFIAAIVLVYMVLASQFDSFIQPLVLMTAQPLAIIGGITGLWLTGHGLNIYSMLGMLLLMGLVAKNSILLIDLTNQRRAEGDAIDAALLHACPVRMRPVLMTSLTVVLSLLPAALGIGAGADSNAPLAVAVIGGMVSSTLLTLVVVPSVYSLVEHGVARLRRVWTHT